MLNIVIDQEFKNLIPPLIEEDRSRLEQSILEEGCRDALVLWGNTLVDGHNRYEICTKYDIPFETTQMDFASRNDAMLWMIKNQLARRNLSAADRILLAQKQRPMLEEIARKNQQEAGGDHKSEEFKKSAVVNSDKSRSEEIAVVQSDKSDPDETPSVYELLGVDPEPPKKANKVNVRDEIAKAAGVGSGTVARFEQIQQKKPELVDDIREHKLSIDAAYKQVKEQERVDKEAKREEQRQENAEKVEQLSSPLEAQGLFQTIVIDPPWDWGDEGDINQFGRAKPDYHTMPIEEIRQLPVGQIADENCHLYLWVTNRSLPKAFSLIEAWGFRYITCITWVKPYFGMGNYFRGDTEQVLFAVKGSQPLKRKDMGTHFEAPRGQGHSAKPNEFYDIVESCSYGPYIDIFGRKDRDGWSVWGENS